MTTWTTKIAKHGDSMTTQMEMLQKLGGWKELNEKATMAGRSPVCRGGEREREREGQLYLVVTKVKITLCTHYSKNIKHIKMLQIKVGHLLGACDFVVCVLRW